MSATPPFFAATLRRFGLGDEDRVAWEQSGLPGEAFEDWLTDRVARRPARRRAREIYGADDVHDFARRAILDAHALEPGDRLLDVGCGGGVLLRDALASGAAVTGLDHSAEMVRLAEERAPRARVVVGTAEQLPFADAAFTAISMSIVFFFLTDPVGVLRECRRVLAPGGRLAVYATAPALRGTPAAPEPLASRGHFYADDELAALARQRGSRRWPWSTTTAVSCSPRALKRARSGRALGQLQHEPAGRLRHRPRVPAPAHLRRAPAPPPG